MKNFIFQKKFLFFVLISFLFFQSIYSFLFPAVGFSDNWLPITNYLPKFKLENTDNFLLEKIYPLTPSEYRVSSDTGNYLELARNFNREYFRDNVFISRPLYSFLIFLVSLPFRFFFSPSYGLIFILAILVNIILITISFFLFFKLLERLLSLRVAFLSSVLLIFSPYVHASLLQPLAEMLMVMAVMVSGYLLYDYLKEPSITKLVIYSLLSGIFMLGKMFFAISIFILILALYFKRHKEGVIFLMVNLLPLLFWYLWVTQVWQIPYHVSEVQSWRMGFWLFDVLRWPWYETARILLSSVPNFVRALIYGFLLIPVLFSVIGFRVLSFRHKNIFYFGPMISFFSLFFIMNLYLAHHAFLLFPIIYPTCILGIERAGVLLKKYQPRLYPVFYGLVILSIIFISNINIYKVFDWIAQ